MNSTTEATRRHASNYWNVDICTYTHRTHTIHNTHYAEVQGKNFHFQEGTNERYCPTTMPSTWVQNCDKRLRQTSSIPQHWQFQVLVGKQHDFLKHFHSREKACMSITTRCIQQIVFHHTATYERCSLRMQANRTSGKEWQVSLLTWATIPMSTNTNVYESVPGKVQRSAQEF